MLSFRILCPPAILLGRALPNIWVLYNGIYIQVLLLYECFYPLQYYMNAFIFDYYMNAFIWLRSPMHQTLSDIYIIIYVTSK